MERQYSNITCLLFLCNLIVFGTVAIQVWSAASSDSLPVCNSELGWCFDNTDEDCQSSCCPCEQRETIYHEKLYRFTMPQSHFVSSLLTEFFGVLLYGYFKLCVNRDNTANILEGLSVSLSVIIVLLWLEPCLTDKMVSMDKLSDTNYNENSDIFVDMTKSHESVSSELGMLKTGFKKSGGKEDFPHDKTKKPQVEDWIFGFRQDRIFRVRPIVCPVTKNSLASYFVSGNYEASASYDQAHLAPEFNKEGVRLASFQNFPKTVSVSAIRLAQAGFFYVGEMDRVKCFSCGVTYHDWKFGDRPTSVHTRISPNCPLVRGSDTTNLPLPQPFSSLPVFDISEGRDSMTDSQPFSAPALLQTELKTDSSPVVTESTDALGIPSALATSMTRATEPAPTAHVPFSMGTSENSISPGSSITGSSAPVDGIVQNLPPRRRLDLGVAVYPLYSQMDARKRSFANWPDNPILPTVDVLIILGFFYAGYADCVRCFFCGIGLKSWEPGDIPAEVHARWRPTCQYLRLVKGDTFVELVANGGRNVTADDISRSNAGGSMNGRPGGDASQGSQENSSLLTPSVQTDGIALPHVPDLPVVSRAKDTGFTDQQIAEGIAKLRIIGMERAIDSMLFEVLTNIFGSDPDTPRQRNIASLQSDATPVNTSSNSQGAGSNSGSSEAVDRHSPDANLQQDGIESDRTDAEQGEQLANERDLIERHNALRQENDRLREMRMCQRCHERQVGVIFLPCGHIVACTVCAPEIRRCIRCDLVIRATANVFFS